MAKELLLIDVSSIAHPIWHTSSNESNINVVSQRIVARVRALSSQHPHAAVCCDSGRSFRRELEPNYKANRPEQEAGLQHQIGLALDMLAEDGFPVWSARGFEADDLIASATVKALADADTTVAIATGDKDMLQLVSDRVRVIAVRDGAVFDPAAVVAKFGLPPAKMRDYLTLVGDSSDNVKGCKDVGPKKAAALLSAHDSIEAIYQRLDAGIVPGVTPSMASSLREFRPRFATTRALISLRTDVELPFHEILSPRTPRVVAPFDLEDSEMDTEIDKAQTPAETAPASPASDAAAPTAAPAQQTAIAVREPDVLAPAPEEWERQLEPRSLREMRLLAKDMHDSRLFLSAYGTPQAVMSTLLAGRELGLQAMAALRAIHIVEGKPTLSADLIRALVIRSGMATYFRCIARSATAATFETQRGDDPPVSLTFTIEEARTAWSKSQDAWDKSGWGKNPADMLVARAGAKLARLVYPDVVHGIYTREELEDAREAVA